MAKGLLALLLCGAVQAHAVRLTTKDSSDVTPVQKVVQMVQELQNKVSAEGKAEAVTYDKFACFCKSKTDEKTKSIAAGEQAVDDATTEITRSTQTATSSTRTSRPPPPRSRATRPR
jgi:hypothetical protein